MREVDYHLLRLPSAWFRLGATVTLACLGAWTIWFEYGRVVPEHGLWDFGAFLASGRAAMAGLDPYGIYPPWTPHVLFPGFEAWNPNLNPPISALLFQAFSLAEPVQSLRVWWWFSLACYIAAVLLLLRRYTSGLDAPLVAVWAFGLAGFWDTLYLGQIYMPLVLLAVIAWLWLERGHGLAAGIMIGLLVSLKPNFLVWPVLLFLAGHRLPSLISVATAATISVMPFLVFDPSIYIDWLRLVVSDGERAIFLTNASFAGLAARMGVPAAAPVFSVLLLLALSVWALIRRPPILAVSGLALLASLLASPLGWVHYTLFLMPVLLHHWHRPWIWVAAALLTIPVPAVLAQFTKPAIAQLTIGSVYGWALILLLAGFFALECRLFKGADGKSANTRFP